MANTAGACAAAVEACWPICPSEGPAFHPSAAGSPLITASAMPLLLQSAIQSRA